MSGVGCRAQHDHELGIGVGEQGAAGVGADLLDHERDSARAADEHDAGEIAGGNARRRDGPVERTERLGRRGPHDGLELGAGHPHLGVKARESNTDDRHLGVDRQRLLGRDAVGTQREHGRDARRDRRCRSRQRPVERGVDVGEHRVVEVDAAEALETLGRAEQPAPLGTDPHDRGVERAAAEVVHGDGVAGRQPTEPA